MSSAAPLPHSGDEPAPRRPMNAARLRTMRQRLGVEIDVLAEMLGINVRNMRKYETGASTMNPAVAARLEALVEEAGVIVDEMLADLEGQDAPSVTIYRNDVELWAAHPDLRPLTVGWHRAIVARVLDELPDLEVDYPPAKDA